MNQMSKKLVALLLSIIMMALPMASLADEETGMDVITVPAGLNTLVSEMSALMSGMDIQEDISFELSDDAAQIIAAMLGDDSEQAIQMADAIVALVNSLSLRGRMGASGMTLAALLQGNEVANLSAYIGEVGITLLTNALPNIALNLSMEEIQAVAAQYTAAITSLDESSSFSVSDETMAALNDLVTSLMGEEGVVTMETGLTEEIDGVIFSDAVCVNLTDKQIMKTVSSLMSIMAADDGIMQLVVMFAGQMNGNEISVDDLKAQLNDQAQEILSQAEEVEEPFIALSVDVYANDAADGVVVINAYDNDEGVMSIDIRMIGGMLDIYISADNTAIYFGCGAGQDENDNTVYGITLIVGEDVLPYDLFDMQTADFSGNNVRFDASAVVALSEDGTQEDIEAECYITAEGMQIGATMQSSAILNPFSMSYSIVPDLTALGMPADLLVINGTSVATEPASMPDTSALQTLSIVSLLNGGDTTALESDFNDNGMMTIMTNLMTYMPEEAMPLLVALMGGQQ